MAGSNPYAEKREGRAERKRQRSSSGSPQPPRQRRRADSREGRNERRAPPDQRARDEPPRPSGDRSPPRQRKRPGQSARLSQTQKDAAAAAARQRDAERETREREQLEQAQRQRGGIHEAIREHYNQVPERGRDWRRTESKIKGLREYNNWVKSCLIQKFSASEDFTPGAGGGGGGGGHYNNDGDGRRGRGERLKVLDIGCGKGGDLFKWQRAPQPVELYIGIDPANVSIQQARGRYEDAKRKSRGRKIFHAEFFARDGFGEWIGEIPIIQQVGIDPNVGPGGNSRWGGGGFDVVTMMFCMHYALESEDKARGMLKNVAGALKKGGRFIGAIPSSDIIRDNIEAFYKNWDKKRQAQQKRKKAQEAEAAEKGERKAEDDRHETNGDATAKDGEEAVNGDAPGSPAFVPGSPAFVPDSPPFVPDSPPLADGDPEDPETGPGGGGVKLPESIVNNNNNNNNTADTTAAEDGADAEQQLVPEKPEPQWGNSIYNVRFPVDTPKDGIFRPPFGWKYSFFLHEAVEAPEYIVPFEAFRALAEEYGLEMTYRKSFMDIWEEERDDRVLGLLSERMGVTDRAGGGQLRMSAEEREACGFYLAFCFVKI